MNHNQSWYCRDFGEDGWVFVGVDLVLPDGALIGMRRAIHPFNVDQDPVLLANTVAEMSEIMGRLSAPPHPTSRACAFGGDQ